MDDYYLGDIALCAFDFAPRNFVFCDGELLTVSDNSYLYALLGTFYGGDGRSTFGVPDLRGRTPIGFGAGPGLSLRNLGDQVGTEDVTLDSKRLPAHTHAGDTVTVSLNGVSVDLTDVRGTQYTSNLPGDTDSASDAYFAATLDVKIFAKNASAKNAMRPGTIQLAGASNLSGTPAVSGEVSSAGQGLPHNNMQPSLAINYCICTQGLFPYRS